MAQVVLKALAPPATARQPGHAAPIAAPAIGSEARRLYAGARLFRKPRHPFTRVAFWPGVRHLLLFAIGTWALLRLGPIARRAARRSQAAQLADLLVLGVRDGIDPLTYYLQELYRPGGRAEAAFYLGRRETKTGLVNALNDLRPRPAPAPTLKDKVLFATHCRRHGLAVPATLLTCGADGIAFAADRAALDRDLFCKPRRGRGARGALAFRRVGPARYADAGGRVLGLDALLQHLARLGRRAPLLVQPQLANHADVADLADRSLVTIRVVTCLDERGRAVVTHGLLRVLSKLEPGWARSDELGAPIDVATGRLGAMTSDRPQRCAERYREHPVTRQPVEGRILATWPALAALAVAAHGAFAHCVLVGWDLAATVDGPVLLEGNGNLDVMFPQRACRQGFGRSALGPLLQHHLKTLEATERQHPRAHAPAA